MENKEIQKLIAKRENKIKKIEENQNKNNKSIILEMYGPIISEFLSDLRSLDSEEVEKYDITKPCPGCGVVGAGCICAIIKPNIS